MIFILCNATNANALVIQQKAAIASVDVCYVLENIISEIVIRMESSAVQIVVDLTKLILRAVHVRLAMLEVLCLLLYG